MKLVRTLALCLLPCAIMLNVACKSDSVTPQPEPKQPVNPVNPDVPNPQKQNIVYKLSTQAEKPEIGTLLKVSLTDTLGNAVEDKVTFKVMPESNYVQELPNRADDGSLQFLILRGEKFSLQATSEKGVSAPLEITTAPHTTLSFEDADNLGMITMSEFKFKEKVWDYENYRFRVVSKLDKPVFIAFGADWCKFCKEAQPFVTEMAKKYDEKVYFLEIDADENEELFRYMRYAFDNKELDNGLPLYVLCSPNGEKSVYMRWTHNPESFKAQITKYFDAALSHK